MKININDIDKVQKANKYFEIQIEKEIKNFKKKYDFFIQLVPPLISIFPKYHYALYLEFKVKNKKNNKIDSFFTRHYLEWKDVKQINRKQYKARALLINTINSAIIYLHKQPDIIKNSIPGLIK